MAPAPKTPEDKAKLISALKEKVSVYLTDEYFTSDGYLFKWIEDKNYNVEKAEKALRRMLKWRLDNNIDSILEEDFEDLYQTIVYYMDGRDKAGRVVVTMPCNLCNIRAALERGDKERLQRFVLQMMERAADIVRTACLKTPEHPSTLISILDFQGIDMTKVKPEGLNFFVGSSVQIEDYYPGHTEFCFIINASKGVKNTYNFMKATLRRTTSQRLKVFGIKRHKWEPEILAMVDADQLRPRFGGRMPDEDEKKEIQNLNFDLKEVKEITQKEGIELKLK